MRYIFYEELKKRCEEIRQMQQTGTPDEISEKNQGLLEVVDEMVYLSTIGRKEGLLALEYVVCNMDPNSKKNLIKIMELIVDGTDPMLVEEICFMKYMANGTKGYDGLKYLMQIVGGLAIQQGENPRIIEEKLLAMVPDEVENIFRKRKEEEIKSWYEQQIEDIDMSKVEQLYVGELNTEIVEKGYEELAKLDYLVKQISDRSLQRALREIDNADLELALKGLSGEGRHRVFINMSKRLCIMIAEDMEQMGKGRLDKIGEAAQKIYYIFMRLMDCYEIMPEESDEIYELYEEYKNKLDTADESANESVVSETQILTLDEIIKQLSKKN